MMTLLKSILKTVSCLAIALNLYLFGTWIYVSAQHQTFEGRLTAFEELMPFQTKMLTAISLGLTFMAFIYPILWHKEKPWLNTSALAANSLFLLLHVWGLM